MEKAATLVNFNKAYLAAQNFSDILIQESLLDPRTFLINSQKNVYNIPKSVAAGLEVDSEQQAVI